MTEKSKKNPLIEEEKRKTLACLSLSERDFCQLRDKLWEWKYFEFLHLAYSLGVRKNVVISLFEARWNLYAKQNRGAPSIGELKSALKKYLK